MTVHAHRLRGRIFLVSTLSALLLPIVGISQCGTEPQDADDDDWTVEDGDCDDNNASVHPGASELCNAVDDDCDGAVDSPIPVDAVTYYYDADLDGYGDPTSTLAACSLPAGYVENAADCNDQDALVNPAATELCNAIDDDCDGAVDSPTPNDAVLYYADADGDGFGDALTYTYACSQPTGFVEDDSDCDDTAASTYPSATEVCNGVDEDCDGVVDSPNPSDGSTWYPDSDNDGYGSNSGAVKACSQPTGYVSGTGDCNDSSTSVVPGTSACPWVSSRPTCKDVLDNGESKGSGVYTLALSSMSASVYCDMTTDGGGWTLLANYKSSLELQPFNHALSQLQDSDAGEVVSSAPRLWESGVYGHIAYTEFPIYGRSLKMQCRTSSTGTWYAVNRNDIFAAWSISDQGTYGSSSGWGIIGGTGRGRSNHFICGSIANSSGVYSGIAYCKGAGASGSWANHQVSFSFTPNDATYGGGLSMGCNGTGLNYGKDANWEGQIWLR